MGKIAKRLGSIALAVLLVIGTVQLPGAAIVSKAADGPTFTVSVDKANAKAGDVVNVSVALSENSDLTAFSFHLNYDKSLLDYVSLNDYSESEDGSPLGASVNVMASSQDGFIQAAGFSLRKITKGGIFLTGSFKVKENVVGNNTFTVSELMASDADMNDLPDGTLVADTSASSTNIIVDLNSISLDKPTLSLTKGTSDTLTVSYDPEIAGTGKTVTWSSDNEAVATVADGKVTAMGAGSATITATVDDKTATCAVTVTNPLQSISLNKTETTLKKGQEETLTVSYNPDDTTDSKTVSWNSSDPSVATVDNAGKITAIKDGSTTITATVGDKTATCTVTVQEVKLKGISLDKTSTKIAKGEKETLTITYNPENTTDDKTATWESSDEKVATVANGEITAVGKGTATITAKVGAFTATCDVVVNVPLKQILLDPTSLTMMKGETKPALKVNYLPLDTDDSKTVTWTSSDNTIATVSNIGVVKALKKGTVTITATGANDIKGTCTVSVDEKAITGVTLNVTEKTLEPAETQQLTATLVPEDNTDDDKTITWSTSDEAVATVSADGLVTAVAGGTATITATTSNGKTATCAITVPIHMTGIALSQDTADLLKGKTEQLSVTYNPENTTDDKTVTWTSSDEAVATVDANGLVTAVAEGTATITATTTVGSFTAECAVTVTENHAKDAEIQPTPATPDTKENEVLLGSSQKLNIIIIADDPTQDVTDTLTYEWISDKTDVIEVAQDGTITAKGLGEATITVKVSNAKGLVATKTITLSVKELPLESIAFENEIKTLEEGSIGQLKIVYTPGNTTADKTVTWTSSDEKVATISKEGMISAIKAGKTTIKAVVGDKEISYELTVTAKKNEGGTGSGNKPADKQNPTKTNGSVKTGDNYQVLPYAMVLFLAAGVIVCTMIMRKRKTK
ncbi:MAG: Ig-like domain-containing protein [Hespellia sp.]|nr:Ig-like domain-containing protein [Hespellia sp.]